MTASVTVAIIVSVLVTTGVDGAEETAADRVASVPGPGIWTAR